MEVDWVRRPAEFTDFPPELRAPFGPYMAIVRHIVDGDTIDCLVDVGFNDYVYRVIRLAGIDAPELNRRETREAGQAARDYLLLLAPPGTPVLLQAKPDHDSFGRYIAELFFGNGSSTLSAAMVEGGHAVWREYR